MGFSLNIGIFVLSVATVLTAILTGLDFLLTGEELTIGDVATDFAEMLVLSGAMVASVVVVERMRNLETETTSMRAELSEAARAGQEWRQSSRHLLQGLSAAITTQFDVWGLTDAEADVAALILKGAPLKDVARLRRTSETTIRQQAQSIYRKSGLANRSELAAYFLEDLFDVAAARTAISSIDHSTH